MFATNELRTKQSKYSYLHNDNVVIKRRRGVAPTSVSWCHVKHHVKFTLKQVLTKATGHARMQKMRKVPFIMYGVFCLTTFLRVHNSKFKYSKCISRAIKLKQVP